MARPKTNHAERKAQIIAAATRIFAHYGYEGTTNKLIAEEVQRTSGQGFSPALIYHYFPEGKLQLFAAVMQASPVQQLGRVVQQDNDAPPEVFLRTVARAYMRVIQEPGVSRLARIFFAEGPRHPALARQVFEKIAPLLLLPMASYFNRQAALGRIRPVNPLAAMFQFFGPLMVRAFVAESLGQQELPFALPTDDEMIESHVQTFLQGLATIPASQKAE